ncbi:hypothetical protein [Mycobacteroides abscessus]|uniref:hypothetical protein n=1 Tax=Mycobacteroides abscessus TaxID=36809 RepID=UPI0009A80AA7|nr:hypothetical protein [Mycobacteroides abscessus]SKD81696.1 Uncharacterised protein [Mycobacteroides abscessus subsp. massiliense]SKH39721.1 Uncharacterised protein [Mycobacteroides abscessus subsp. massiliense]SKI31498.1 Uncharacterised protein [Mycobacteroides abscessus subsp. massiliense]SKJ17951.1 Uncharacterised protein [Mycobacteroides abscessus subsp. massiliense]SKJ91151.1 Uncharacterised protein [Mycobacteroides abscessus subsp. massiliense]
MTNRRFVTPVVGAVGILAGVLAALTAPVAAADPPPIPFVPGVPAPLPAVPGSYTYSYYNFPAVAPATTDARGIKIATNADPGATAAGLPGSKLGNSAHPPNIQSSSSTRYGIAGGVAAPPAPSTTGVNYGGGNESPALEDPYGRPPQNIKAIEAPAPPTVMPGAPTPPVLEDPHGEPPAPPETP